MTREEMEELNGLAASMGLYEDRNPCKRAVILGKAIKELKQEPKWIPITERLPEEKTAVLLSCDNMYLARLNPCIGWRNGNYWHTFSAKGSYLVKYPIAWMPLSQPYKAECEVRRWE